MKLTKWLPYEHFVLITHLKGDEIVQKLQQHVEPKKWLRLPFKKPGKPYEGSVHFGYFNITRIINYRNSFLPEIDGKIIEQFTVTEVHIKMQMNIFVILFMITWLGFTGVATILMAFVSSAVIAPAFMFTFGWCLMLGGFKYESRISTKWLKDVLEAKEWEVS